MIVLNGEPFVRYNLRSLYPFAHQIVVVEGACPSARGVARQDGHSSDGTLDVLERFRTEEDPENKVQVVTAEDEGHDDGFWSEKTEMSRAYAKRAQGNYLWQVDCDEFYLPDAMRHLLEILRDDPRITAVSFRMFTFWGGPAYRTYGPYLGTVMRDVHRVFAWKPGYEYATHRPPTVLDEHGRDVRQLRPLSAGETARHGIVLYHYELLFPKQVREKCRYYAHAQWLDRLHDLERWAEDSFVQLRRPYRVHMVYEAWSWLERHEGQHPPQIAAMMEEVRRGGHPGVEPRQTDDIEALLASPAYCLGRAGLKLTLACGALRHTLGPRICRRVRGVAARLMRLLRWSGRRYSAS